MLYQPLLKPLLFTLDPETAHHLTMNAARLLQAVPGGLGLIQALYGSQPPEALAQSVLGRSFKSPLGIAAGFDKNIRIPRVLQALGAGYVEVGSVSAQGWPGNKRPRLFRLPADQAIINRMGLNNDGVEALQARLNGLPSDWPVGISLVKTPDPTVLEAAALDDFAEGLAGIYGHGAYVSINISCPNTEEGKTFEEPEALDQLLHHLRQAEAELRSDDPEQQISRPWCLKLSPDLAPAQLDELFDVGLRYQVAGWVACNTSSRRDSLKTSPSILKAIGGGGLSGPPIQSPSTAVLAHLYQRVRASQSGQVLIGVGGVRDAQSAWEKITHGASLLQLYTGLVYEGPGVIGVIHNGLARLLDENGLTKLDEAVGLALQ